MATGILNPVVIRPVCNLFAPTLLSCIVLDAMVDCGQGYVLAALLGLHISLFILLHSKILFVCKTAAFGTRQTGFPRLPSNATDALLHTRW